MATEKKYLDLQGLQHLKEQKVLVKHPTKTSKDPAAVKVGQDANGHVILSNDPLTAADVGALPDTTVIGNADITVKLGDLTQSFNVNETTDKTLTFTKADLRDQLGITGAMHFAGTTTTELSDGAKTNPIKVNNKDYTAIAGDVALYNGKEFIFTAASVWEVLGDEGSYALKTRTITGDGTYITGGGTLEANRVLSHKTYQAEDPALRKIGRDAGGHVNLGDEVSISETAAGKHGHTTTSSIPANTYVDTVNKTTATLKTTPTSDTFLKSYSGTPGRLETTTISGVKGSTTASKATKETAIDVAKAGTAVVYGKADVGEAVTVATRASTQTTVGNADRAATATVVGDASVGDEITIAGVDGSTTASKASAGTAVSVAKAGSAKTVATRAATATTVGDASVGDEITITGVSGSVIASKATAQTAVVYGNADVGTKISGLAKRSSSPITVGNATMGTAKDVATSVKSATATTTAMKATYDATTECLTFTVGTVTPTVTLNTTSVTPAVESTTTAYVCTSDQVDVVPAKDADTTRKITPYTFADVTVPKAATSATTFNAAKLSTTSIYGCGDNTTVTPAVANGTITPYTFTDVTVPVAAEATTFNAAKRSETSIYGAVESSTKI